MRSFPCLMLVLLALITSGCTLAASKDLFYMRFDNAFKADSVSVETPTIKARVNGVESKPELKVIEKLVDKLPGL